MTTPLESLVASGTKLWLDSVDPDFVATNRQFGATGATSNPVIISDIIKSGRFDSQIEELINQGLSDEEIAWALTDRLVSEAQAVFRPVWEETEGNDGWVSFELDPLLEDPELGPPHEERVARYIALGKKWAKGQDNRMIKIPATPAGLDALEELAAVGITINVTLCFTPRQYRIARENLFAGAKRYGNLDRFKSVYSIFVSRVDVYTEQHVPELSDEAQGLVGIVNAKQVYLENRDFWAKNPTKLQQEIIFASTGTKKPEDPPGKYVEAFAGDGIETNPPETNDKVQQSGRTITAQVSELPSQAIVEEIATKVDIANMEEVLMREGIDKFAKPQHALINLIASKRKSLSPTS